MTRDAVAHWQAAADGLHWAHPWHTALRTDDPTWPSGVRWFDGGTLNAAVNAVDRHVAAGHGDRVAFHVEGEAGDRRTVTYAQLHDEVCRAANVLTDLGVRAGDRVVLYLPVLLETVVAALATVRIGAVHSLVFSGFSTDALRTRIDDVTPSLVVTSDGQHRRGRSQPLKPTVDAAVAAADHRVDHVLVVARTGDEVAWTDGRDHWWHEALAAAPATHVPDAFDAEHPLFVIHTSGTTGRPKGLVHTTGGYLTQAAWTHAALFDLSRAPSTGDTPRAPSTGDIPRAPSTGDVYWCTADLAWVTAHTYVLYGPLLNGATQVLYEGTPDTPSWRRHLEVIDRYGVTIYYTAPTLVRSLMARFPDGPPDDLDVSSLRVLGSVGEPINPQAWRWFHDRLGGGRAPVVDTWWQSETGAAMVATLPGAHPTTPGVAGRAVPGIGVRVVDRDGIEVPTGTDGQLVIDQPWPAMARTVWGDPDRYVASYLAPFAAHGWFATGDGARIDGHGDVTVLGRLDDVINVSGHRLSAVEIESALVADPAVAEAGVTAVPDATTGQAVVAFVVPVEAPAEAQDPHAWAARSVAFEPAARAAVTARIGPIARPTRTVVVPELPKTRSGKILRRLLGELVVAAAAGDEHPEHGVASDTTSLHEPAVLEHTQAILTALDTADHDDDPEA